MAVSIPMMKRKITSVDGGKEILANDHYVGVSFCADRDYKAGDLFVDALHNIYGVCLYDVNTLENPNGTAVIHGFIDSTKLEEEQITAIVEAKDVLRMIQLVL